jgi:preprotein translocase subunit SecE
MISMRIKVYLQEVYTELIHKVSWPTWKDLQSSAIIVMIASLLIALVIFLMDISFETIMDFIYKMMF